MKNLTSILIKRNTVNMSLFIAFLTLSVCMPQETQAQTNDIKATGLVGAWTTTFTQGDTTFTQVSIVDPAYVSVSIFNEEEKVFYGTYGGSWILDGNQLALTFEFNTIAAEAVGTTQTSEIMLEDGRIRFAESELSWNRIDDGTPGELSGAWLITGRKRDGEIRSRTPGVRKTMKILSGTRFQWIAYNTETKEFRGTGGGTYTTIDGKYTETIEFFSRDGSRVGAVLPFDFSLEEGAWHHSGLSSKGQSIYEIWTLRTELDGGE